MEAGQNEIILGDAPADEGSQLQHLYEAVLEMDLDKRNFRKKVLGFGLLAPLKETLMAGRHRPAQLFSFDAEKYEKVKERGFNFGL
jgi:8-oxo-dGTP diphosphatase